MSIAPTKKNRKGSKLRRNVKDQYLGKLKFIQRQNKFLDRTAAIFKSKWPKLGRPVFLVLKSLILKLFFYVKTLETYCYILEEK